MIDFSTIISMRARVVNQLLQNNEDPMDIIFAEKNGQINMGDQPPYNGDFPPSQKYIVRKNVVEAIITGKLLPNHTSFDKIFYTSYEPLYSVDYCFEIIPLTGKVKLYLSRNGEIIRKYDPYKKDYDERDDLNSLDSSSQDAQGENSLWTKIRNIFK